MQEKKLLATGLAFLSFTVLRISIFLFDILLPPRVRHCQSWVCVVGDDFFSLSLLRSFFFLHMVICRKNRIDTRRSRRHRWLQNSATTAATALHVEGIYSTHSYTRTHKICDGQTVTDNQRIRSSKIEKRSLRLRRYWACMNVCLCETPHSTETNSEALAG